MPRRPARPTARTAATDSAVSQPALAERASTTRAGKARPIRADYTGSGRFLEGAAERDEGLLVAAGGAAPHPLAVPDLEGPVVAEGDDGRSAQPEIARLV